MSLAQVFSLGSLDRSVSDAHRFFLPEYELLDFVIQSSFTMALREYSELYGVVPMRDIYKGGHGGGSGGRSSGADWLQIACGPCRTTLFRTMCSSGRTNAPSSCPKRRGGGNMPALPRAWSALWS